MEYSSDESKIADLIGEAQNAAEGGEGKRAWELLKDARALIHAYLPDDGSDNFHFDNWRNAMNTVHRTISRVSGGGFYQETWFMGKAAADRQRDR